jgi:hypothetical protein
MTKRSKYRAELDADCIRFINPYNEAEYGYVNVGEKPFPVHLPDGEPIGAVDSLCDALPLILDAWERNYLQHRKRELEREKKAARGTTD